MSKTPLIPLVAASIFTFLGCRAYVEPDVPPPPSVRISAGFTPLYYNGHAVYYEQGVPVYYVEGQPRYVPASRRTVYVRHYERNRNEYSRWRDRNPPRQRYERDRRDRYDRRDDRRRGPRVEDPRRHHDPR